MKADLAERFASLPGFGPALWERTSATLEAYHGAWVLEHQRVCQATSVHKDRTAAAMELSMGCLERRKAEFAGVLNALKTVPLENLPKAADARALLVSPDACLRPSEALALPQDATVRAAIVQMRPTLAEWNARAAMGELDVAAAGIAPLRDEAERLGYLPLVAEVGAALGIVLSKSGDFDGAEEAYRRAIRTGTESRHDRLVAKAWLDLSWLYGYHQESYAQAEGALDTGLAFAKRLGEPAELSMLYARNRGWVLLRQGNAKEALAQYHKAITLAVDASNADRDVAILYGDIGAAHLKLGQLEEAAEFTQNAVQRFSTLLGKEHPDTLAMRFNYASIARGRGNSELAISETRAVLAGFRASIKSNAPFVGMVLTNLATMYADAERWDLAESTYREAIAVNREVAKAPGSTSLAVAIHGLATVVQLDAKRYAEAETLHRESLEMKEALLGAQHPSVAISLSGLADLYVATARRPEAVDALERGLAIVTEAFGETHPHTVYLSGQLAEIQGSSD